jgi:hypothetical protein
MLENPPLVSLPEGPRTKGARLLSQPRPDSGRSYPLFVTVTIIGMMMIVTTTTIITIIIIAAIVVIGDDDDVVGWRVRIDGGNAPNPGALLVWGSERP